MERFHILGYLEPFFLFYYYIFMRQTRNTGRCPILALTSSFRYMPSVFLTVFSTSRWSLFLEFTGPHCLYCRYCAPRYLIWSGSNTVCLRAADPPASLTGFSIVPFERDQPRQGRLSTWRRHVRPPLRWISRTSAGEEVVPAPTKDKAPDPHRLFASLRGPSSDSLWGTFQRGCRVIAAAEGHAALCRLR